MMGGVRVIMIRIYSVMMLGEILMIYSVCDANKRVFESSIQYILYIYLCIYILLVYSIYMLSFYTTVCSNVIACLVKEGVRSH